MTDAMIRDALNRASKAGAHGYEVVGFGYPATATSRPTLILIVKPEEPRTAGDLHWSDQ